MEDQRAMRVVALATVAVGLMAVPSCPSWLWYVVNCNLKAFSVNFIKPIYVVS